MGLDMYLTTNSKKLSEGINQPKEGLEDYKNSWLKSRRRAGVIAQWRKANQIHGWFVDHVQDGVDDCGCYDVTNAQLAELLVTVNAVINSTNLVGGKVICGKTYIDGIGWVDSVRDGLVMRDTSVARSLLPTIEGLHFGGTEYDQWYYYELIDTKQQLEAILRLVKDHPYPHVKGEKGWELRIQYHASW